MDRSERRVVITGIGVISPIGRSPQEIWEAVQVGRSGLARPSAIPREVIPLRAAGEVKEFTGNVKDFGEMDREAQKNLRKALKVMCRECQMGVAAGQLALNDAGIRMGTFAPER
ncbi:MAG: beta-ketoacyl synthase N-terminal-like domain-containing protein, partial [Anaerolineae bacterium]